MKPVNNASRASERAAARLLVRVVQLLPDLQGPEVFAVLRRAFRRAFGLRVVIVRGPADRQGAGERDAIARAISERTETGGGTPFFPGLPFTCLPLLAGNHIVGVLLVKASPHLAEIAETELFRAFRAQTVLSVLRFGLDEEARRARAFQEADRIQKVLLSSISHNVRTPMASILGSLSTLRDQASMLSESTQRDLIDNALEEAERLSRLFRNLLDLSRLEAGALSRRSDLCDVQDVIGAAIEQLGAAAAGRRVQVLTAPDLPFVRMDFVLITQALVNVLENALKYAGHADPVVVEAVVQNGTLSISVLDEGSGIPEHELTNIFEKFNRGGRSGETGGLGLGLSISRGFVEAHGGRIWAERRHPRGAAVRLVIPPPTDIR